MRPSLVIALLLLAAPAANATLYNWTGTVDWGRATGQSASGAFNLDFNAPPDPDNPGAFQGGASRFSLDVGPNLYTSLSSRSFWYRNGRPTFVDMPCSTDGGRTSADFQFNGDRDDEFGWSLQWNEGGIAQEIGGHILRLAGAPVAAENDAAPTPEPSSLVLSLAALAAFAAFRRRPIRR